MNISSVVLIPGPGAAQQVLKQMEDVPGVEVAATSPEGRLIVTIETDSERENVALFEHLSRMDGVMSASMVYHQQESDPEAEICVSHPLRCSQTAHP